MYYRLVFDAPTVGARTLLHFGAVDWQTSVYLNGGLLGNHTGGYDGFSFDVTGALRLSGNELLLHVFDPSDSGSQPQGKQKQGAVSNPGWPPLNGSHIHGKCPQCNWFATFGIVYTPSLGVWQTPWIESVPSRYIDAVRISQASQTAVTVNVSMAGGATTADARAAVSFRVMDGPVLVAAGSGKVGVAIAIVVPAAKLWSPASPHLYDLEVRLAGGDVVTSYFGLRTFALPDKPNGGGSPATVVMRDRDMNGLDMEPCRSMPGTGCPGAKGKNDTIAACKARCESTAGCEGYVFKPAGGTCGGGTVCWIKASIVPPPGGWPGNSSRSCRDSQVLARPATAYHPLLNGNRTFLTGSLDQSWWPDGEYTAPTDAALESDLTATRKIGFNTIRLHQKVLNTCFQIHA
jgi:hypothetical protein